ncbi:hypothetical protein MUCCIDRAFT_106920 [Mucor lusitanicus CBS 277.49]|uniref:Uncharacterized protein n=1 Tax=Mucor lusitanicus CBS 277.49 TaxID=747725 RepID=A0A162RIR4_MUCCL|nr:hypothetical protein MUCCIDRAFT_106920 [Mucor lusitanicus CBS 277.49]
MAKRPHPEETKPLQEPKKISTVRNTSAIFDITCASPATLQGNTDLAFYDTMIAALTNWGPLGCKESFKHTAKFLRSWGVILNENGSDLCSIMNGTVKHNMRIKSEQHPESVSPKGFLLLYCLAEHFNCTVFLFSTRKKPTIIKPMQGDRATRNFAALLCHQDSFMQKTTWFSLKRQDGFIRNSSALKAPSSLANANNDIVATKFVKDSKKARHETIYSNEKSDQQVMKHLQEEVFSVYRKRWCEFLQKKQSSKSVDDFRKTLSTKSLPNKVVSKVQVQMEQQLGNIQPGWVQAVIQRLRTAKTMPTAAQYVALFIKDLKKELETAQNVEQAPVEQLQLEQVKLEQVLVVEQALVEQVQLGQVQLGQVQLGQVQLGQVQLGQVLVVEQVLGLKMERVVLELVALEVTKSSEVCLVL